jgi:hypothetical protein
MPRYSRSVGHESLQPGNQREEWKERSDAQHVEACAMAI